MKVSINNLETIYRNTFNVDFNGFEWNYKSEYTKFMNQISPNEIKYHQME